MPRVLPAAAAALLFAAPWAVAQDALLARNLAATCANCHGTEGRTIDGSAVPSLAGMPRDYMIKQMTAFQDGSRPATVTNASSTAINKGQQMM